MPVLARAFCSIDGKFSRDFLHLFAQELFAPKAVLLTEATKHGIDEIKN